MNQNKNMLDHLKSINVYAISLIFGIIASSLLLLPSLRPISIVHAANINGTDQDDFLVGTNGSDIIDGRSGDDTIFGNGGNDTLIGGMGDDTILGGAGGAPHIYGGIRR